MCNKEQCTHHCWGSWYLQLHHPMSLKLLQNCCLFWTKKLLRKEIFTIYSSSLMEDFQRFKRTIFAFQKKYSLVYFWSKFIMPNLFIWSTCPQVAKAKASVQLVDEKLDSLITIFRQQLQIFDLEFISVSGITHLIEVFQLKLLPGDSSLSNSSFEN